MRPLPVLALLAALLAAAPFLSCSPDERGSVNKAIVRGYMEDILNKGDLTAADRYFPRDGFVLNGRRIPIEHLGAMRQSLLSRFPDFHLTIEDQIAEGDKVVTRVTFHGTHLGTLRGAAPTGTRVTYTGIAIDRIVDGKVVEGWHEADEVAMLRQLGMFPN